MTEAANSTGAIFEDAECNAPKNGVAPRITMELAAFVGCFDGRSIPSEARRIALKGIIDCAGVLLAGSSEEAPAILERTLASEKGEARLYFGERRARAPEAAWINATAAHALDFDDVAIKGHPSAVLLPTLLAEAACRDVTGAQIVEAYVVGYEVWAELVLRDPDQHHIKGWHPTSVFGAVGAAAACARLVGLAHIQTSHALALAASQSGGLTASFGSMAKSLQVGRAAYAGVLSTRLAEGGMTAGIGAMESAQGLLMATSPKGRVDLASPVRVGNKWQILNYGLNIKQYPLCLSTHRAMRGVRKLMSEHHLGPGDIVRVVVTMSQRNARILCHHSPQNSLEAKFSIEFAVAAMFIAGNVTLLDVRDDFVQRPDVQAWMRRVELEICGEEDPATGYAPFDTVSVWTGSGEAFEIQITEIAGSEELPLSESDHRNKFQTCVEVAGFAAGKELWDALISLDRSVPARQLIGRWL